MKKNTAKTIAFLLISGTAALASQGCSSDADPGPWYSNVDFKRLTALHSLCTRTPLAQSKSILRVAGNPLASNFQQKAYQCASRADSCAAFWACQGGDSNHPCKPGEFTRRCNADGKLEWCPASQDGSFSFVHTVDCAVASVGGTCVNVESAGGSICASGTCSVDGPSCDGDVSVTCYEGHEIRRNCRESGLSCIGGGCGEPRESCSQSHCEGSTLLTCSGSSVVSKTNCGLLEAGLECVNDSDGPRCAKPMAPKPCDGRNTPRCAGDKAYVCIAGAEIEIPCDAALGSVCSDGCPASSTYPCTPTPRCVNPKGGITP